VRAVDHLSFRVASGELFGLVGPDGAGKTTTMRVLAGVMAPEEGSVTLCGHDVLRDPESIKLKISYMPQRFGLYEDLTVNENIRFYADLFGVSRRERTAAAARLLAACGMSEFGARLAGKLSGGMKQKLALVCALIHTPKVLLLDEPTNGVDPISRREFWAMLYNLVGQGVTVINSTAYLDEAERCHRVGLMHRGRLLFCDTPSRLKEQMPGAVVAVVSPVASRLREELAHADGVTSVLLIGDSVHLFVDDAARRIPQLCRALDAKGLPYHEVVWITPTIEDLFVNAVTGQDTKSNGN
jgi:ABC-2 type transport system ATP-binding protein